MTPKCIVFDVDDTLYLERDYVRSGFCAVGRRIDEEFGIQNFGSIAWRLFREGHRGDIFDRVIEKLGAKELDTEIPRMVKWYRHHDPQISLLPDARAAIDRLDGDHDLAVLTGGPLASQRKKVEALRLIELFDPIIYARQWGEEFDKPDPRSFRELQKQVGCPHECCIYIADNPEKDFRAPARLGWGMIRIRRPKSLHEDHPSPSDVKEIHSLAELSEHIARC